MAAAEEQDVGRKRRRDFEHNRDVILNAANKAFVELGMGASINTIAKRAGVAPATVYRHFPSRSTLVEAVFELRVEAYAAAIEDAQTASDPAEAFRRTIHAIVALQASDRSFREILSSRDQHPEQDPSFVRFGTALLGALENARTTGVIRDDVADADIMMLLVATEGIARPTGNQSQAALHRFVDLALDGLCHADTKLAGPPLEFDQILKVTRS